MRKTEIIVLQQYAISKGGQLISTQYINTNSYVLWQCKEGHQWEATWHSIKYCNSWCPFCVYEELSKIKRTNIYQLQQYAILKGGQLISKEYINSYTPVLWECEQKHQWEAQWHNIKNGNWCPYCADNKRALQQRTDINVLQQYAINKGGKLLSTEYINNHNPLLWECDKLHQWIVSWDRVKNYNTWCPKCTSFKTEQLCKQLLEQKLGFKFKKKRFYFDDSLFEWDGYNEEHKIAFEYQGYQHYEFPNAFHKTEDSFLLQQIRDHYKEQYAKKNSITLLVIPYTKKDNLKEYIDSLIKEKLNGSI